MDTRQLTKFAPDSALASAVRDLCLDGFGGFDKAAPAPSVSAWEPIRAKGTTLWLDTGDVDAASELWCAEFDALTTNNTLLNREVQKGIYDDFVPVAAEAIRSADPEIDERALVLELAFCLNAKHGLHLVETFGTHVSVELHTDLAHDAAASIAYGRRYAAICPERFIVKIPLTASGLIAARSLSDEGIPVNFTLGFSARQNLLISRIAKPEWCNVFMGRINAFLADNGLGDGVNAGERATAASQRVCTSLREQGLSPTKQIGASMRSAEQVPGLAGLDVYTIPTGVAKSYLAEGGEVGDGVQSEFPVTFADGVDIAGDRVETFWNVSAAEERAIEKLAEQDIKALDASSLCAILAEHGAADFFPQLDDDAMAQVAEEGKIPVKNSWIDGVRRGALAWDTMLTLAGLASFAQDQAALDERIRTQL